MADFSLSRLITLLLVLCTAVVLVPLIALATFNHPSPTDDYCFANTVLHYGFWNAQQLYYDGWTGRFFHNFIVHTNPIIIGWFGAYKIYPILLLGLLMGGCYALASQWLNTRATGETKLAVTLGLFLGFMTSLPSLAEYLYWYTGLASYGLSSTLFLFLLAVLIAHQRRGFRLQPGYVLAESLLISAIIGSSEMTMVLMVLVLGLLILGELLHHRRVSATSVVLVLVTGVSCYYLLKAPGNAIRIGGNPNSRDVKLTVISSVQYALAYVPKQLFLSAWLPLALLYVPVGWKLVGSYARVTDLPGYLRLPLWLGVLHGVGTVLALIGLHYYGVGIPPIPRLINIVNLVFWLSLLYNLTLLLVTLRHRILAERFVVYLKPVAGVALAWAVLAAAFGPLLPLVYGDWLSGRAAQYDHDMQARYRMMTQTSETANRKVPPLRVYPASLFLEDMHTNPDYLWNRCWADYYHHKTVALTHEFVPPVK